ncbi:hypothetical protein T12_6957 [Trichinella patagoniensis]|uniref:Uncharacterized protein n=1 Tax=Trichinella patagoniensis TaxID=990121 RepID=A0A0V0ZSF3_9BILA|nr:hypothetical protein T12_6957 [Trichinella patagoniensis]
MDEVFQNAPLSSLIYLAFSGCNTSFCLMFNSAGDCYLQITEFSSFDVFEQRPYHEKSIILRMVSVHNSCIALQWASSSSTINAASALMRTRSGLSAPTRHLFEKGHDCVVTLDYQAMAGRTLLAYVCQGLGGTFAESAFFDALTASDVFCPGGCGVRSKFHSHYKISSTGAAVDQPGVSYCVPRKFVPSAALIRLEKTLIAFFLVDAPGSFNDFRVAGDVPPCDEELCHQSRKGVGRSSHLGECLLPTEQDILPKGSESQSTIS